MLMAILEPLQHGLKHAKKRLNDGMIRTDM